MVIPEIPTLLDDLSANICIYFPVNREFLHFSDADYDELNTS